MEAHFSQRSRHDNNFRCAGYTERNILGEYVELPRYCKPRRSGNDQPWYFAVGRIFDMDAVSTSDDFPCGGNIIAHDLFQLVQ